MLTVTSGTVVEVRTKEASGGQITPSTTTEDLADLDFGLIHPLTGPVYVEGARPGDVLAVTAIEAHMLVSISRSRPAPLPPTAPAGNWGRSPTSRLRRSSSRERG